MDERCARAEYANAAENTRLREGYLTGSNWENITDIRRKSFGEIKEYPFLPIPLLFISVDGILRQCVSAHARQPLRI